MHSKSITWKGKVDWTLTVDSSYTFFPTPSGGSEGATMRFKPESDHGGNAGLGIARKLLEPIKEKHPEVSYADLYILAGIVAIEGSNTLYYEMLHCLDGKKLTRECINDWPEFLLLKFRDGRSIGWFPLGSKRCGWGEKAWRGPPFLTGRTTARRVLAGVEGHGRTTSPRHLSQDGLRRQGHCSIVRWYL